MVHKPTREELFSRITEHLKYRQGSLSCKLLWKGYLAALIEWGLLNPDDHFELNQMIGGEGADELREIFLGHPDS